MADNSTACSQFVSDLQKNLDKVEALAKAPMVLIHHMNRLARKITSDMLSDFNGGIMDKLNGVIDGLPNFEPNISDVIAGLNMLKSNNCAAMLSGVAGATHMIDVAVSVLGKCTTYANAPAFIHDFINKNITNAAMSEVEGLLNQNVFGQLNKLSEAYSKFMGASGITSALSNMDKVLNCLGSNCAASSMFTDAYDKFSTQVDGISSKLSLSSDFSISNASEKVVSGVSSTVKDGIAATNSKISAVRTTITSFKLGM